MSAFATHRAVAVLRGAGIVAILTAVRFIPT